MLHIYTDGACSGNPGPGGWAYIMVLAEESKFTPIGEESGGQLNTTNNRMELLALISALKGLKSGKDLPKKLIFFTDSQYVQKGITEWINLWKKNSWKTSGKTPVKNRDLWMELDDLISSLKNDGYEISYKWVKGHDGNEYNERCDILAKNSIASLT